jgi:hypothetical protein
LAAGLAEVFDLFAGQKIAVLINAIPATDSTTPQIHFFLTVSRNANLLSVGLVFLLLIENILSAHSSPYLQKHHIIFY